VRAAMCGSDLVRATALPPIAAVSAGRAVPSDRLPTTLPSEHLPHDGHSATTRLSAPMLHHLRHSDGHHTFVSATVRLRRGRQRLDRMPAAMPTGLRDEQRSHDRMSAMPGEPHRHAHHQSQRSLLSRACALPASLHRG
jgi:hypothetical protein